MPVVVGSSGEQLGFVTNVILDEDANLWVGVTVARWRLIPREHALLTVDIVAIERDALIARSSESLVHLRDVRDIPQMDRRRPIKGRPVVTPDGEWLGRVVDVWIDERGRRIEGYELSLSGLAGLFANRVFLSAAGSFVASEHLVIAPTPLAPLRVEPSDTSNRHEIS